MHIYFRKIYKFIKKAHKSSSYNSLIYKILHVKYSFFTKRFLKATVQLSSHIDECLKHSDYTRVSLAFSCCFGINYIVLVLDSLFSFFFGIQA